ncbi:heterokaryon incompatibility protein-domain-containing protein [Pyrenochaeta sp. MPI-SDFR-AT-0127]|nr:heterokaryon incompatibility protein-domain-containing protein [Pyrenochaeta sp. MPI-SDFR-AT-0127]
MLEKIPTRLLEISNDAAQVRLIDTGGKQHLYVALSYRWGNQNDEDNLTWKTTTKTIHNNQSTGISTRCLPPTLRDSIFITHRLGLSHIWIDSLCILQDSAEDWAQEAANMASVYVGSVLTIAVSGASSWDDGCFRRCATWSFESGRCDNDLQMLESELSSGQRSRLYIMSQSGFREMGYQGHSGDVGDDQRSDDDPYDRSIEAYLTSVHNSPLATRGWTFQEYLLARRTVYYTSEQLFWECQHGCYSEDNFPQFQITRPHPVLDAQPLHYRAMMDHWYRKTVQRYSHRHLTVASDRLIAISALANATYARYPVPYIAGLWRDSMIQGMMWQNQGLGGKNTTYRCPAWSWVSQEFGVEYLESVDIRKDTKDPRGWWTAYCPDVVNVKWISDPTTQFADVISASIYLKTKISIGVFFPHLPRRFDRNMIHQNQVGGPQSKISKKVHYQCSDTGWNTLWDKNPVIMVSSSKMSTIWKFAAHLDTPHNQGCKFAIAYLGVDSIVFDFEDSTPKPSNMLFLLLEPPKLDASEYRRVGLARCLNYFPKKGSNYELSPVDKSDPLNEWAQRTITLV